MSKKHFKLDTFIKYLETASDRILLSMEKPIDVLIDLVHEYPQHSGETFNYLVASGLAVEAITNVNRLHRDIDLVVFDDKQQGKWSARKVDITTPNNYWSNLCFNKKFLTNSAVEIPLHDRKTTLWIVHPAILLIQKVSDHKDLPLREKDQIDISAMIKYFKNTKSNKSEWQKIIAESIYYLPSKQRKKTINKLHSLELQYEINLLTKK